MNFPLPPLPFTLPATGPLPLFPAPGHLLLDNSALERLARCPRAFEYERVHQRQPAGDKAALAFGKALHAALAARYSVADPRQPLSAAQLAEVVQTGVAALPAVPPDEWRTPDRLDDLIRKYLAEHPADDWCVLAVEQPFCLSLGTGYTEHAYTRTDGQESYEWQVWYAGRIDLVVENSDGLLVTPDHKTTSRYGSEYVAGGVNSGQFRGYCWAARHLLGRPCNWSLVNALICRPHTTSGKGKPTEFDRQCHYYSDELIEEWRQDVLQHCESILRYSQAGRWPQQPSACVGKYGLCGYHDVCRAAPAQRAAVLASPVFQDCQWSPLRDDTEGGL